MHVALLTLFSDVARCTDLAFDIDLGNGKGYDASGMLVWNMGIEAIAFVGMGPFRSSSASTSSCQQTCVTSYRQSGRP
eukprot:4693518-Prymnesium_polylepis.1